MAFFSVIIPTFNRLPLLKEALTSVWRQTFTDYEVIVVDDGSTDGTHEYLKSLQDRITALTQMNGGPGAARNLGISHARGEYVAFLDSDDMWFPWTLDTFHRALSIHSWPTHLMGNAVASVNCAETYPTPTWSSEIFEYYPDFLSSVKKSIIWSSGVAVVRRCAFAEGILFGTEMRCFEDQDIGLQLGCAPGFVHILAPFTVRVRPTAESLTRSETQNSFAGLNMLMRKEHCGYYPGGVARQKERRAYICLSLRSLSIGLAQQGEVGNGWVLYWRGLLWNLLLHRFRYIIGFPLLSLWPRLTRTSVRSNTK